MGNVIKTIKGVVRTLGIRAVPGLYSRYKMRAIRSLTHEQEVLLLPLLCHREKTSLDIGASGGIFTVRALELSNKTIAFEPRADAAERLRAVLRLTGAAVEEVALSDATGPRLLRVLAREPGRSTIEDQNHLRSSAGNPMTTCVVLSLTLDSYQFSNVGFIKIDVEGHELSVLRGGLQTLSTSRPAVLVEAEDRHRPDAVRDIADFFVGLNYSGYFLLDGRLTSIDHFDSTQHQDPVNIGGPDEGFRRLGTYINNFVFVPAERSGELKEQIDAAFPDGLPTV